MTNTIVQAAVEGKKFAEFVKRDIGLFNGVELVRESQGKNVWASDESQCLVKSNMEGKI